MKENRNKISIEHIVCSVVQSIFFIDLNLIYRQLTHTKFDIPCLNLFEYFDFSYSKKHSRSVIGFNHFQSGAVFLSSVP